MRVLITGGGGFCGSHLVLSLQRQNVETHTVGVGGSGKYRHAIESVGDVSRLRVILRELKPSYILHLAGTARAKDWSRFYEANAVYAASILQATKDELGDRCPVLLMGSGAEYGAVSAENLPLRETHICRPLSLYGASKLAQTELAMIAHAEGLPTIVARGFNFLGSGMAPGLAPKDFTVQAVRIARGLQEPVIHAGPLYTKRDYLDIETSVRALWDLIRQPKSYGQVVNICSGQPLAMLDLLQEILFAAKVEARIESSTQPLGRTDVPSHFGDNSRLSGLVGWRPEFDLKQSVSAMVQAEISGGAL